MYIRRKVFSVAIDQATGEEKLFSVNELDQRGFSSKAQKLLRNKRDVEVGIKKIKELRSAFKPELIGPETVINAKQYGREMNKHLRPIKSNSTIHEKIGAKGRIRDLQKKGIYDNYTADKMIQDTISPDLSTRKLIRELNK